VREVLVITASSEPQVPQRAHSGLKNVTNFLTLCQVAQEFTNLCSPLCLWLMCCQDQHGQIADVKALGAHVLHDTVSKPLANPIDWVLDTESKSTVFGHRNHLLVVGSTPSELEDQTGRIQSQMALEDSTIMSANVRNRRYCC
jgi:hypothetical protein